MTNTSIQLQKKHTAYIPTPIEGNQENALLKCLSMAQEALSKAKTIEDASQSRQHIKALEALTKEFKLSKDIQLDATELRIRAERRLGEILLAMEKNRGAEGNPGGRGTPVVRLHHVTTQPTITDLGITKRDSSNFQQLAKVKPETFDAVITDCRCEAQHSKISALSTSRILKIVREVERGDRVPEYSPIIKPSDNWNFNVQYGRIDESLEKDWGYIPGEIYANCFWYYVKPGDLVVAPMAGAGQALRVYEARSEWMGKHVYDFELKVFDLNPRGKYKHLISQNNLVEQFPVNNPDYIILDVPYYGMVKNQYSTSAQDLANMNFMDWQAAMDAIAHSCATSQQFGKLCTVISPNYRDVPTGKIIVVTDIIRQLWENAGYIMYDKAYSTRRIQQAQNPDMARMNNRAKANRVMLTDITEILTFRKL